VRCPAGHSFDVARQGYVNLVPWRGLADTVAMVEAREAFLAAGHFEPLTEALVAEARATAVAGCVVDVGAGPGHHLTRVLDALPDRLGIALDSSKPALRQAARAHPRAGAVGCDAWQPLPVRDDVAAVVLSVFAPRRGDELARVLAPGGIVVVAAPDERHLAELVEALGLLTVPDDKRERTEARLAPHLAPASSRTVEFPLALSRADAAALVRMGPSAWHVDEESAAERLAAMPEPIAVTASVIVSRYAAA
jgi:23S rRNA (guanine745-N1)-methyltransferase